MSFKNSNDELRQSLEGNMRRYEAIALSMAISFEIEDFIEARKISKQDLAKAAGVSPSYLSQVFSGEKLFNLSMLAGIAQKYDLRFQMKIEDAAIENDAEAIFAEPKLPSMGKHEIYDFSSYKPWPRDENNCLKRVSGVDDGC